MRPVRLFLAVPLLFGLAACDDARPSAADAGEKAVPATPTMGAAAASAATAMTAATAATLQLPPRPFPVGSSGPVQPSAPPEQQMMAITYTLAMVAPRPTDPSVDKVYIDEIVKKLEVAVRSADKGKTPANPVKAEKGNRKLEVQMGKGCTDRLPLNLITSRAGSSLQAAYQAGVMVIACHDDRWECHQSTRDPADVLCHAAPRR
jgi:hypothetical protein